MSAAPSAAPLGVFLGVLDKDSSGELFVCRAAERRAYIDKAGYIQSAAVIDVAAVRRELARADVDSSAETTAHLDGSYAGWPTVAVVLAEGSLMSGPHAVPVHFFRHVRDYGTQGVNGVYLPWALVKPVLETFGRVDTGVVHALNRRRMQPALSGGGRGGA